MTSSAEFERRWRKSSYSTSKIDEDCVEIAFASKTVAVRDSKDPDGGHLTLTPAGFRALLAHVVREP